MTELDENDLLSRCLSCSSYPKVKESEHMTGCIFLQCTSCSRQSTTETNMTNAIISWQNYNRK